MNFRAIGLTFALAVVLTPQVSADCIDILRLSRLTKTEVRDASEIANYARTFCSEYDSIKQGKQSAAAGFAYGILSASFGSGSASYDAVHSRYCDSVNQNSARSDAFRSYIESIAPGTYDAYLRCTELEGVGVQISVQQASVLPTSLALTVSFSSKMQSEQTISFATSPDVTCGWLNGATGNLKLVNGSSNLLKCARPAAASASFVQILATTSPNATFAFAWPRFEKDLPVDELGSLRAELASSLQALRSAVVAAFDLSECPKGWKEYVPAQGRFIRGIDKGYGVDPEGRRLPGSLQDDAFASHTHTRPADVYNAGKYESGAAACGECQGYGYETPPLTGAEGGKETRPRNVALLYCTPSD